MIKKNIMIIDDEREFLEQFGEMLNLSGYETILCQDGKTGLEKLNQSKTDMVLLDLNMNGVDGFEVARQIKNNPKTHKVPIIIVSGRLTDENIERLNKENGATAYLSKPVKPLTIIAEIEKTFAKFS